MASATFRKQDMPPPGGFKPLNYDRIPTKPYMGGKTLILANIGLTAGALYLYSLNLRKVEREKIEMSSSIFAITPMILAERDREYLKQLRRNRDEEAKLMANVEGWEVGKYQGEPIYKSVAPDTLLKQSVDEYFVHTESKFLKKYKHILHWD